MGSMLLNWAICFMAFSVEFNNTCGILRTKFHFLVLSKYPCNNSLNIYFIRSSAYSLEDKILRIKVVFYLPISNQMNPCLIVLVSWLHCKGANHIKVSPRRYRAPRTICWEHVFLSFSMMWVQVSGFSFFTKCFPKTYIQNPSHVY